MLARITAAAVLTFCSSLAPAQATSPSDSMFRGDLAHSGVYPGPAPKSIDHVVWQFKTFGHVVSSPVAANGMVYIGSDDHFVYAIDALKGTAEWKFGTDAAVRSTPAVAGGSVFVLSLDGNLYALDARSGKLQWKFATGGESRMSAPGLYEMQPALEVMPDVWDFFLSSPAVDNGTVYFGSGDHHVYAVDALTGRLRWKFLAGDVVHSSPAIADGTLYIGCWDGLLYALNAHTGQLLWKFVSGADPTRFMQGIPGSPAVASGIVVFGSRDNFIYALDSRSGTMSSISPLRTRCSFAPSTSKPETRASMYLSSPTVFRPPQSPPATPTSAPSMAGFTTSTSRHTRSPASSRFRMAAAFRFCSPRMAISTPA